MNYESPKSTEERISRYYEQEAVKEKKKPAAGAFINHRYGLDPWRGQKYNTGFGWPKLSPHRRNREKAQCK